MTFENAIEFKKTLPEKIVFSGLEYIVMVVPENIIDLNEYYKKYLRYECTDETAKEFSSNRNYEVYGIHISHEMIIIPRKLS